MIISIVPSDDCYVVILEKDGYGSSLAFGDGDTLSVVEHVIYDAICEINKKIQTRGE